MTILMLCGSPRPQSSTARFLAAFPSIISKETPKTSLEHTWLMQPSLGDLPLFTPSALEAEQGGKTPEVFTKVIALRQNLRNADAVVIATPEYAHNLPAALKSALEWTVASGEFSRKPVLAITCTPHPPRGEYCMRSLVWTLQALDANVLAEVPLYDVARKLDAQGRVVDKEMREVLEACLELLGVA